MSTNEHNQRITYVTPPEDSGLLLKPNTFDESNRVGSIRMLHQIKVDSTMANLRFLRGAYH